MTDCLPRVLILDDDPRSSRDLAVALEPVSRLDLVTSPLSLSTLLSERDVDVLVVQSTLLEADALAVAHGVRARWPEVAVVLALPKLTEDRVLQALAAGVDGFIQEPADATAARATVREAFRRSTDRRLAARAERLLAVVGSVVGVSREIGNTLTLLLTRLELLKEGPLPDDARQLVQRASGDGTSLAELVRALRRNCQGESAGAVATSHEALRAVGPIAG